MRTPALTALITLLSVSAFVPIGLAIPPRTHTDWVYTTYSNGVTSIAVAETIKNGHYYNGYTTVSNGERILGGFHISTIRRDRSYVYLSGTFADLCTGKITIRRPYNQTGQPIVAQITWTVTRQPVPLPYRTPYNGGRTQNQSCDIPVGQQFTLNLPEALPQPTAQGEFTNQNSNTFFYSDFFTWPKWHVVATDGVLNCRSQPNGTVQHTYRTGQNLWKLGREMLSGSNFTQAADGSSWLMTAEKCYVRASDRYIQPVSLPEF